MLRCSDKPVKDVALLEDKGFGWITSGEMTEVVQFTR
jgi:hypothetical protein